MLAPASPGLCQSFVNQRLAYIDIADADLTKRAAILIAAFQAPVSIEYDTIFGSKKLFHAGFGFHAFDALGLAGILGTPAFLN